MGHATCMEGRDLHEHRINYDGRQIVRSAILSNKLGGLVHVNCGMLTVFMRWVVLNSLCHYCKMDQKFSTFLDRSFDTSRISDKRDKSGARA